MSSCQRIGLSLKIVIDDALTGPQTTTATIERVTNTMATVVGDINAIAHDAIPGLETLDQLALPGDMEAGD